jgi:hypothetical protein
VPRCPKARTVLLPEVGMCSCKLLQRLVYELNLQLLPGAVVTTALTSAIPALDRAVIFRAF